MKDAAQLIKKSGVKSITLVDLTPLVLRTIFGRPEKTAPQVVIETAEKIAQLQNPICFLDSRVSLRKQENKKYKERRKLPEDVAQKAHRCIKGLKGVLPEHFNVPVVSARGYEADDLICAFCKHLKELDKTIVSPDNDMFVLLDERTRIQRPDTIFTLEDFKSKFGVSPKKWIVIKALMGDKSDGVKGVLGIGIKKALKMVKEHPDVLKELDETQKQEFLSALQMVEPREPEMVFVW